MKKPSIHDLYRSIIAKNTPDSRTQENTALDESNKPEDAINEPLLGTSALKEVKLFLWDFKQCDSKKCTGRKLLRMGLAHPLKINATFRGLVLSPAATTIISPEDIKIASYGLAVIDCSWNQLDKVPFHKLKNKNMRLLPKLIASNPIHYGKPFELSCIEAYTAALIILEQADKLISIYDWMDQFIGLNEQLQEHLKINPQE